MRVALTSTAKYHIRFRVGDRVDRAFDADLLAKRRPIGTKGRARVDFRSACAFRLWRLVSKYEAARVECLQQDEPARTVVRHRRRSKAPSRPARPDTRAASANSVRKMSIGSDGRPIFFLCRRTLPVLLSLTSGSACKRRARRSWRSASPSCTWPASVASWSISSSLVISTGLTIHSRISDGRELRADAVEQVGFVALAGDGVADRAFLGARRAPSPFFHEARDPDPLHGAIGAVAHSRCQRKETESQQENRFRET